VDKFGAAFLGWSLSTESFAILTVLLSSRGAEKRKRSKFNLTNLAAFS